MILREIKAWICDDFDILRGNVKEFEVRVSDGKAWSIRAFDGDICGKWKYEINLGDQKKKKKEIKQKSIIFL